MRSAISIAAHLFQFLDAVILQAIRQGRTHARVILMIASAFDEDVLAVEEEASIGIEAKSANAERRFVPVNFTAILFDRGDEVIEVWRFERPELRIANDHLRRKLAFFSRTEFDL